jgi:hypothetical protein
MSAVVKTRTPFLNKNLLLEVLDEMGIEYQVQGEKIITERKDYYGKQCFILNNGQYFFQHDSSANNLARYPQYPWDHNFKEGKTVHEFLSNVEVRYKLAETRLLKHLAEEERKRIEEEKRQFVEQQKQKIIEKSKQQGYSVKEKTKGKKVQLVLVRQTY